MLSRVCSDESSSFTDEHRLTSTRRLLTFIRNCWATALKLLTSTQQHRSPRTGHFGIAQGHGCLLVKRSSSQCDDIVCKLLEVDQEVRVEGLHLMIFVRTKGFHVDVQGRESTS